MRQKLITLDPTSWDLAAKKPNFSQWVRDQLRSERNKTVVKSQWCRACRGKPVRNGNAYCRDCQIDMGIRGEEE
jgi:hypothetical protein